MYSVIVFSRTVMCSNLVQAHACTSHMLHTLNNEVHCKMHMLVCCLGVVVSTFPDSFYVRQFSSSLKAILIMLKFNFDILRGYLESKTVIVTCVCVCVCVCVCKLTDRRFQYFKCTELKKPSPDSTLKYLYTCKNTA